MMELSPVTQPLHNAGYCCLKPDPELHVNPHTWTRATTLLFVEHPIGTGFSYGHPYPENETEASADLDAFLQNFFQIFTHLQTADFYVMGESYAGKYSSNPTLTIFFARAQILFSSSKLQFLFDETGMFVPAVSRYIHKANKRALADGNSDRFEIPLKGAALGNGWIDVSVNCA